MSSDANKLKDSKLTITGILDAEQVKLANSKPEVNRYTDADNKGIILQETSEVVEFPEDLGTFKLAYGDIYPEDMPDLDIELDRIRLLEPKLKKGKKDAKLAAKEEIKFHYRQAVGYISPKFAKGWNQWSEDILEMFLSPKMRKVLFGSGNCGKSAVMAILLYTKWRVNPKGRMVMIASKVVADAKARVFGYLKTIHQEAPAPYDCDIRMVDNSREKAIYHVMVDKKTGKEVNNDQGCIISVPVKVTAGDASIGTNLLGRHPDDWLCIGFDECQELPASRMRQIFANWYTNENVEIMGWGNPQPIEFYNKESHDLLYHMGLGDLKLDRLRFWEKQANQTFVRTNGNTYLLHLSMLHSPRDSDEELYNYIEVNGVKKQRLHFLGGKTTAKVIAEGDIVVNGPEWYSQVLGFPYIDTSGRGSKGVVSPYTIKIARDFPLEWHTPRSQLNMYMGVDPSVNGLKDPCSIQIAAEGEMMNGCRGVDLFGGEYSRLVRHREGEEFTDTMVNAIYALSQEHNIPLRNIAIEITGAGQALKYALSKKLEEGLWADEVRQGQNFYYYDSAAGVTERPLFRTLGKMRPAKDIVDRRVTECWVALKCAFQTRQIFNVPEVIVKQMYNRYLLSNSNSTKYKLEKKTDLAKRGIKSPNETDALAAMFDLMRFRDFKYQYHSKAGYQYKYGPQAQQLADVKTIEHRKRLISSMLGVNNNFPIKKGRRRNKGGV